MIDRLLASALVHALHPERSVQTAAAELAEQAIDHPEALDRALALLMRRAGERPTALTERAAQSLRLARSLAITAAAATAAAAAAVARPPAALPVPPPLAPSYVLG